MSLKSLLKDDKGLALFIALMLTFMLSMIGLFLINTTNDEIAIAGNELNEMKSFYAAESGLSLAAAMIQTQFEATGLPPSNLPDTTLMIDHVALALRTVAEDTVTNVLTKGPMAGLNAITSPFTIFATAYDSSHNTAMVLRQSFEVSLVPIFQFGVFYEYDLEVAAGPTMTLDGRIHTNGNAYLQAGSSSELLIDSYLTSAGNINHGRHPGSGLASASGDVRIKDMYGNYQDMERTAGQWLDANDSYWFDSASYIWGGRVQDNAFGQERLALPVADPTNSHAIIDRASAGGGNPDSYELKAGFKIMDGQAFHYNTSLGVWQNRTAELTASGALTETTFFDDRENADITVYDIDMSVFKNSSYFPDNGIIYTADNRAGLRGTRLVNAENIGAAMTLASENVVYTKGDINTTTKKPMAIMADALMILSSAWSDDPAIAGSSDFMTDRNAVSTTINFSYITGNMETRNGNYNGGLENLPRFLEDWNGLDLVFRGSIINMWRSQETIETWSGDYYRPPVRDWGFDSDLSDPTLLPPGTPMVRTFINMGWKQSDLGFTLY